MTTASTFICQEPHSFESRAIAYLTMVDDRAKRVLCPIDELSAHQAQLKSGQATPLGSTEYVARALSICGAPQPEPLSYPACLRPHLKRDLVQTTSGQALASPAPLFIKPRATKLFTGFLYRGAGALHEDPSDQEQLAAAQALPPDTVLWACPPIQITSEVRFYFLNGRLYDASRYDANEDEDCTLPSGQDAQAMCDALSAELAVPFNGSIDLGHGPELGTFLVEVNDGYALGLYSGVDRRLYAEMLAARWAQLILAPSRT